MPRLATALLGGVFLTLVAAPAAAEWKRIDTPNFVVVGDVGEGTLKEIAVKFEGFRETLGRVLGAHVTATPVPTVVIAFPSDKAMTPFKPTFNGKPVALSGLFMGRQDANSIAVVANAGADGLRVVFHEYAHLVVSNVTQTLPVWLNEGLAEYYSTFELAGNRKSALVGRVVSSHLQLLAEHSLMPLPELIAIDHTSKHYNEGNQRSVFYAESWALTHMLLQGQPDRRPQTGRYLTATTLGTDATTAWRQAFGDEDLKRPLEAYLRRHSFNAIRYSFSEKIADFTASATRLPPADADGFRAYFLLQQGRIEEAAALLAGRKDTDTSAWLETVSGMIQHRQGDVEGARARLAAVDAGQDWLTAYFLGIGLADLTSRGATADEVAAVARPFRLAQQLYGEIPQALIRLARVELDAEAIPPSSTTQAVARARAQVPGRVEYAYVLARLQARQQAFDDARATMGPLMSGVYPEQVRDSARALMQYIVSKEAYEKARASAAASRAARAATAAADPDGEAPPVEPTELPDTLPRGLTPEERAERTEATRAAAEETIPADTLRLSDLPSFYRVVQPGETRLEGTLSAIRCGDSGPAVFELTTAEGMQRISTPRLGDVDFVAYRDDLGGAVACGPLPSPMRVYLTTRPDPATRGGSVIVAVEFLPK
jgi:Protein of unknown function (DUF1570)